MASRFLNSLKINDAYTLPSSDGSNGQVIVTDGSGNLAFANPATSSSASIIYRDNFTGDGSTVAFTLQNSLSDEDQTFIYIDGVYQEKGTYSLSTNTITFTTAPDTGHSIEVISVSGINVGPTTIYQDNFTGDGTTTDFTLAQVVDNEVKTMIYFNGVYQFKGTYSLNGTALSFDTAPANGVDIEVISIASAAAADYNQKVLFYGKANEAISKGDAIMLGGQEGDHFLLSKATQTAIAANHEYFLGLASQDLAQGEFGYVTEFGKITELDTSGYTAGDILWFDAGGSTAGALTTTEPAAPLAKIQVAAVIRSHQNEGVLFIRPSWYHELGELHDVNITSVADKDILAWNNTQGYWENTKTLDSLTANTLSATTLTGTLSTAAQPNITSVGTLSGLDLNGVVNLTYLAYFVGSSNYGFRFNNSADTFNNVIFYDNGNAYFRSDVGIGTTNPVRKLVVSNGGANGIELDPNISGNSEIISYNRSTSSYTPLNFEASRFSLLNGNVGIGNTNPTSYSGYKVLHIGNNSTGGLGLIKFANGVTMDGPELYATGNSLRLNTNGNTNVLNIVGSDVAIGTTSALLPSGSRGNLSINGPAESILTLGIGGTWKSYYFVNSSATYLASSSGTPLIFEAGGTEKMRINSGGSVGINTTSTRQKLVVNGHAEVTASNSFKASYNNTDSYHGALSWATLQLGNNGDNRIIGGRTAIGGNLSFYVNNTNDATSYSTAPDGILAMRIASSGNVGIGTTSPDTKLHVESSSYDDFIKLTRTGVGSMGISATSPRGIQTTDGSGNFLGWHVDSSGKVGIGTPYPDYRLVVSGTGTERVRVGSTNNTTAGVYFTVRSGGSLVGNGTIATQNNGDMRFFTGTNSESVNMCITSVGNVGIGTTSPTQHISGTEKVLHIQDSNAASINLDATGSSGRTYVLSSIQAGHLRIYDDDAGQWRFTLNSSGNVGIGTTSPGEKLSVNGNIVALDANAAGPVYSYFGLFTENGSLPGYTSNNYPTLKTDDEYMYFAANGQYLSYLGYDSTNSRVNFGIRGSGGDTVIRGGSGNFSEFRDDVRRKNIGGSHYIALSGRLSGYTVDAFNCIKTSQGDMHFDVGGVYTGYISSNSGFVDVSDASLKTNVEYITDALTIVSNLKGRKYNWIDENRGVGKQVGFIAQEVEEFVPEVVTEGAEGTKGVAYGKLTAVLVEAIKEQQAIIEDLKARIETLENN